MVGQYLNDFFIFMGEEWVFYLLIMLSVVSVYIMVERFRSFRQEDDDLDALTIKLRRAAQSGEIEKELAGFTGVASRVARAGLQQRTRGYATVEETINASIARERFKLEKNTIFLGTLGNNAPFIGLFGTVLGVIRAFRDLGNAGADASTTTVMAGISAALVATAIGLLVALPAVMVYNLLGRRIKQLTTGAQVASHIILSELKEQKE
jgi:biopolymer transport protein ExbB